MTEDPVPRSFLAERPRHPGLFLAIAPSLVVFGTTVALAIRAGAWRSRGPIPEKSAEAILPRAASVTTHRSG